jgi:tetratricopeptide (TPR) repeat protein
MRLRKTVAALAVLCASCAHRTASVKPLPAPTAIERQILNAVDAGDGDLEIRQLRARMAAQPESVAIRIELAQAYAARGYPELTIEHSRLAAARFPANPDVQLLLARALRDMGLRPEAARGLEAFLSAYPQTAPKYAAWLGILRDEMGQWPQGESAHRAALAVAPETAWLRNNLGYNLLMQGRHEEASAQFREALRLDPASVVARNNLGLAVASKPGEAVLHWQSVSDPATAHSNLAALLIEQGKYEQARQEIKAALDYNGNHPAALKNLRLVAQLDGKPATLDVKRTESRWSRFGSALRKAILGNTGEKL